MTLGWLLLSCGLEGTIGIDPDFVDDDEDGFSEVEGDCDDADTQVGPEFPEACDGLDNDCDGTIDGLACLRDETFVATPVLDLLIVIDNSLSMLAEQQRIAEGLPDLLEEEHLMNPDYDIHIGVITSDMASPEHGGRLVEYDDRRWIDSTMAESEAVAWVTGATTLGVADTASEQPRAAIYAALSEHVDGVNDGYRRPGADLGIIILSNEDDNSPSPTLADFVDWLDYSPGLDHTQTYPIVPDDESPDCESGCCKAEALQHHDLVIETGGLDLNVCADDYGSFLVAVGQDVVRTATPDRFELRDLADPTSVEVWLTHPTGTMTQLNSDEFVYDVLGNQIVISKDVPAAGRVTVSYQALPEI